MTHGLSMLSLCLSSPQSSLEFQLFLLPSEVACNLDENYIAINMIRPPGKAFYVLINEVHILGFNLSLTLVVLIYDPWSIKATTPSFSNTKKKSKVSLGSFPVLISLFVGII